MTFDEMLSFTVDGGKATSDLLGDSSYIYYPFSGWRIQFGHGKGSSSELSFTDDLKAAEWREYEEPVKQGWDFIPVAKPVTVAQTKRGRKPKVWDMPINDIDDAPKPTQGWDSYE